MQFDVYKNGNPRTSVEVPYLLNIQSNILKKYSTRVVAPLVKDIKIVDNLNPVFEINGENYTMLTTEIAGLPLQYIGAKVTNVSHKRDEILHAIDFLFTGV